MTVICYTIISTSAVICICQVWSLVNICIYRMTLLAIGSERFDKWTIVKVICISIQMALIACCCWRMAHRYLSRITIACIGWIMTITALPVIFRCLRRYHESKYWLNSMVNCWLNKGIICWIMSHTGIWIIGEYIDTVIMAIWTVNSSCNIYSARPVVPDDRRWEIALCMTIRTCPCSCGKFRLEHSSNVIMTFQAVAVIQDSRTFGWIHILMFAEWLLY